MVQQSHGRMPIERRKMVTSNKRMSFQYYCYNNNWIFHIPRLLSQTTACQYGKIQNNNFLLTIEHYIEILR